MKKVSKETLVRTVVLVIALANSFLTMFGKNPLPFSENEIYQAISAICTVAATIWAWWKNNSFTQPAIKADEYMKELKTAQKKKVDSDKETIDNKEDKTE